MSRIRHNKSTSNLIHHADICDPATVAGSGSIKAFAQGSTYHPAKHCMKIALWVAWHHHPFSIIQDKVLLSIFHDLNSQCRMPSWVTVSRDIKEIFKLSCAKVAAILQVHIASMLFFPSDAIFFQWQAYHGKLHLCIDSWTAPQVITYLGATVHWIQNGCIQSVILDFIQWICLYFNWYLLEF